MTYLTLGQYTIPISWIAFFAAIIYSDFRNHKAADVTDKLLSRLFWVYLLVWKLSYILFSWSSFLQAPASLLYFDGGLYGHILAMIAVSILLMRKHGVFMWEVGWQYWTRFIAVSQLISFSFTEQWVLASAWLVVLIIVEWRWRQWILLAQWTLLLWSNDWLDAVVLAYGLVIISIILKQHSNQLRKQFITLAVMLSLLTITFTDYRAPISAADRPLIDLMTTTQERYTWSEQEQQLTVVNFFATWCPPCHAEMPHLQNFAEHLPEHVQLVGINLTQRDRGPEELQHFMERYGVTYPILLDTSDVYGQAFRVKAIPTTVILDHEGQELERIVGPISEYSLKKLIAKFE